MLNEYTINQLRTLRLAGMVRAIEGQASSAAVAPLDFEERLTLLVYREVDWRDGRRVTRLLKAARLKVSTACVEDIDWRASRAPEKSLVTTLAGGDWLRHGQSFLITGATGCDKTRLACALAHQAARSGFSVLYTRAARLFGELQVAHRDAASPEGWRNWPSWTCWPSTTSRSRPSARPIATTCWRCSATGWARARR